MLRNKFRSLLLGLAVILMLPQWGGTVAAADAPGVSNFYNILFQNGGDPWVYKHTDGYYYYTHTTGGNVTLWRSKTITGLEGGDRMVAWTPPRGTMYSSNIWAPEIHHVQGKWYIYFAADNGTNANHRMYVLENDSDNPLTGTWTFKGKITDPSDRWAIDGTVLEVADQLYFLWSGWENTDGSFQNLYIAEMSNPWTISSERVLISESEYDWESSPARINEGPQVNIRGNTINLVYSANGSWTDSYCLGLITADISDDLMDPASWNKKSEPIFSTANGVYGPGHHSLTTSPDGSEDWLLYHAARWQSSGWTRSIRAQAFTWNADDTPNLGVPVDPNAPIAIPSGEPSRQRYEAEQARLVKDPLSGTGPSVRREATASGGMKISPIDQGGDVVEFNVNVQNEGFYTMSARTANGSASGGTAHLILSVNGGSGGRLNAVYSGWNHWGVSTARVHLKPGDNSIRFLKGEHHVEIDSLDVIGPVEGIAFDAPGYTLGRTETRTLPPVLELAADPGSEAPVQPVAGGVTYSVPVDNQVVEVTDPSTGTVRAVGPGSTVITASYGGHTATATITVAEQAPALQSIVLSGLKPLLVSGQSSQPLRLTAHFSDYEVVDITGAATVASSNPEVAAVTEDGLVQALQPGESVITAAYEGKEASFRLTVAADPDASQIQVPPVLAKTPSGRVPELPGEIPVTGQDGVTGMAEVTWKLQGVDFNSLGTVQVYGLLKEAGIPAEAQVEVLPSWGLDELVSIMRSRVMNFSYPLGDGLGNYSQAAYDALLTELDVAEALSAEAELEEGQFEEAVVRLDDAEAALLDSLNLIEDGVVYHAYRDFSGDETGKYPYGITTEDLTNGAIAAVQEEGGNRFLRLTTTATSGKANLFLPFAGEVHAGPDERIVIAYRARLNSSFQYANGAMVRNDSGTGNYSMVTAFDTGKIIVQNGPSTKTRVQDAVLNKWYDIRMVANWDAKTYSVYIDDTLVATDYSFRHTGGEKLTGQRFGIDGYANASIDFDDFRVLITGGAKAAPQGLTVNPETAEDAKDGQITGLNGAMEWSSDEGANWLRFGDDESVLTDLAPGTYWIRYRATDTHQASPHVALSVLPYTPSEQPVSVTGVRLNPTNATLYTNHGSSTVQLTAHVEPADATNREVTWSSSNPAVASVDAQGLVRVHAAGTAVITVTTDEGGHTATSTVTAAVYSTGGGWNGPVGPPVGPEPGNDTDPAETEEPVQHADGSSTTITTDPESGAVTEITSWPNGDRQVITKETDGTTSETFTSQDGSKRELVTRPDGSSRALITESNGVQVEILTSTRGEVTAKVQLPVGTTQAWITLPVKDASSFTVAYSVDADGSRTILGTSMLTEDGLSFLARGDLSVQLMENRIAFSDVSSSHWAAGAIAFTASRELFRGTEPGRFAPGASMSRAMLFTVLARLDGTETEGGELWYSKAQDWAIAAGISDGSAPSAAISREQLITLLHRYAGAPAADGDSTSLADSGEIAAWAVHAMNWAVATGILNGKPGNLLDPGASVTRAEVATILVRFIVAMM
ncbi:family 43 glycosylhydrolase [Paenibacillus daejeonensis]|uniref:family 43 glycosylhydrolase n=1 Tax=Paenibacillus daejeonensis TaxID=135193 RepID=UPI0003788E5D|nr:family 43 glycosylhydrolase [Paenibacillus daejeonensis]